MDFLMYHPANDRIQSEFQGACGIEKMHTELGYSLADNGFELHKIAGIAEAALDRRFSQPVGDCATSVVDGAETAPNGTSPDGHTTMSGSMPASVAGMLLAVLLVRQ